MTEQGDRLRQLRDRLHECDVLIDELIRTEDAIDDTNLDREMYQAGVRALRAVRNQS